MKNIRFSICVLLMVSFFSSNAQNIGSSWTIKNPGARTTKHSFTMGDAKMYTYLKKKQKAIVFEENKINPNVYKKRALQFKNVSSGEILFEQILNGGELNVVSIPLKPIKKKYGKDINNQEFVVIELADETFDLGRVIYTYKSKADEQEVEN